MSKAAYDVNGAAPVVLQNSVEVQSGNYPWLRLDLTIGDSHSHLIADPVQFYDLAQGGIKSLLVGKENPEATPEEKRLKQLVKTAIKGLFLTFGGKILDMLFQSKDHPRPGKGDDLIEWYSNIFAQIILTECTNGILVLKARGYSFGDTRPIIIDEIRTFSTSETQPGTNRSDATGAQEGTGNRESGPCSECDQ